MKTELKVLFFSPVAWILLIVFAFQVGIEFSGTLSDQLRYVGLGYNPYNLSNDFICGYSGLINQMLGNLYLYIPLLTMALMSRELGSGSIKLLYSSPVSNFQIIFGKYLSAIVYCLVMIFIVLIPTIYTCFIIKDPDIAAMATAILGMFLTISAYAAIGLFMSTITRYQVVAAVGTLALLAALNFIKGVGQDIDFVKDITYWLAISGRSEVFTDGMICTRDLVYFILIIGMFLSLSIIKLRGERMKLSTLNSVAKYAAVIVGVIVVGYFSSRPKFIVYYDATLAKSNTLTKESQDVMKRIPKGLTITSYSNFLDDSYHQCAPSSQNYDIQKFEKYLRFRPDMKLKYVYYWGEGTNKYLDERYPDLTTEQKFYRHCEDYDVSPKRFKSEADIKHDISADYGRFVRVISCDNGRIAYLRKYDDQYVDPFESGITAAFKTLVDKSPLVAFATGHGERGSNDYGDKGYGTFATSIGFRNALINQGFTVREISLDSLVSSDVDVMVISDMKSEFSNQENDNYNEFLNRGGNILVLGEPRRQKFMNPLIEPLGLQFSEGIIVAPSKEYSDEIVSSVISESAVDATPYFSKMLGKYNVITPTACAVNVFADKGFKVSEVLSSPAKGSWIEYETTDFNNEKSTIGKGEAEKSYPVILYLNRKVGDKEQRIFVAGDSDFLSTNELSSSRAGLNGNNFMMITELFRNFSYDEYPVETKFTRPTDDELYVGETGYQISKILLMFVLPLSLLAFSILSWLKRRGR